MLRKINKNEIHVFASFRINNKAGKKSYDTFLENSFSDKL